MSRLGDLPTELFDNIIDRFLDSSYLPEIFRARAVCHLFEDAINYRLLAKTSIATFEGYEKSTNPESAVPKLAAPKLSGRVAGFIRKSIGTTSIATFKDHEGSAVSKLSGQVVGFIRTDIGTVIFYRAQKLTTGDPCFPPFINQLADELLRFETSQT
jgi:hypothetical protein